MKTDAALLQAFAATGEQVAFTALVARHLDLVYSAALRQVGGDAHLAQDVAQSVFRDLARKAATLTDRPALAGWLYTSAHFAAAKAVRAERRRRAREQEAHAMLETNSPERAATPDWERIRPVLDAAMLELKDAEREAVLLRFFSGRSFAEIGAALSLSEDTARKRVERALDKLHGLLARRGFAASGATLSVALSQHAVSAAPAGMAEAVSGSALTGTAVAAGPAGMLFGFCMSKLTFTAAVLVGLALLSVAIGQRWQETRLHSEIAELRRDVSGARVATIAAERRARDLRAALAADVAKIVPEPEVAPVVLTANQLAFLDNSYAALFRRLRLPEEKLNALRQLLVEGDGGIRRFVREKGLDDGDLNFSDWDELYTIWRRPRARALLGESGYAYYEFFLRTRRHRSTLSSSSGLLDAMAEPFDDEQLDQLVEWMEEYTPRIAKEFQPAPGIPDEVIRRATAILSPAQLEKLIVVRDGRDAVTRMMAMNRTAAEQGRLKLVGESARHYSARPSNPAAIP